MRIGIIGPMEEEVTLLKAAIENQSVVNIGNRDYISGSYSGHEVVLVKSGIGTVCAAEAALTLALHFKCDAIINSGCAGGIGPGLKIGDIVISNKLAYHDFDLKIFGYKRGQVPSYEQYFNADHALIAKAEAVAAKLQSDEGFEPNVCTGDVLTGDQFIANKPLCVAMREDFPEAMVTEMEGAAVAHVCCDFKVPFLVIRSVSDTADGDSPKVFDEFVQLAADNSAKLLLALIKAM